MELKKEDVKKIDKHGFGLLLRFTFILSMLASILSCCTVRRAWARLLEL